jgi:hypothetical protein
MVNDELVIIFGVFDDDISALMLKLFRPHLFLEVTATSMN